MIRCLSFDPGKHCGWALVQLRPRDPIGVVLAAGVLDPGGEPSIVAALSAAKSRRRHDEKALFEGRARAERKPIPPAPPPYPFQQLLEEHEPALVAVEVARGEAYSSKASGVASLLASNDAGGRIIGACQVLDFDFVQLTAGQWRQGTVGKASADDGAIGNWVARWLRWEAGARLTAAQRKHAHDAAALGWFAGQERLKAGAMGKAGGMR